MKLDKEQKRVLKAFWPAILVFPFGFPLFSSKIPKGTTKYLSIKKY